MDFKTATDQLCGGVSHEELAKALGVSVATIRQARLRSEAKAHRSPPDKWEDTLIDIADAQIQRYRQLVSELHGMRQRNLFPETKRRKRA